MDSRRGLKLSDLPPRINAVDCGLIGRTIEHRGQRLVVPPRGRSVTVETFGVTGAKELTVGVDPSGRLRNERPRSTPMVHAGVEGGGGNPCWVKAYSHRGTYVSGSLRWYYNSGTAPTNLGPYYSRRAIIRGANAIVNGHHDCPRLGKDGIQTAHIYAGDTSRYAEAHSDGDCHLFVDNVNVVS